jgi:hypothetical protein
MASPQNALDYAKRFVGRVPLDDTEIKLRLLDDAHKKLWMAAPWRWTISVGQTLTLVSGQHIYPLSPVPTDCLYPVSAYITDGVEKYDLLVSPVFDHVPLVGRPSLMRLTSTTQTNNTVLVNPAPVTSQNTQLLLWHYKKTAVPVTSANVAGEYILLGVPDEWFWVYQEIVLLKAYQFTNSPRLGSVTVANGNVQYSGQYGVV